LQEQHMQLSGSTIVGGVWQPCMGWRSAFWLFIAAEEKQRFVVCKQA